MNLFSRSTEQGTAGNTRFRCGQRRWPGHRPSILSDSIFTAIKALIIDDLRRRYRSGHPADLQKTELFSIALAGTARLAHQKGQEKN